MFERQPDAFGPFDLIGDVHGCYEELLCLLDRLGYQQTGRHYGYGLLSGPVFSHPQGRKIIFLGDLVDRGPGILDTLRLVYCMMQAGHALCVRGNHDDKLLRKLNGRHVEIRHGLESTLDELAALPPDEQERFTQDLRTFLETLPHHLILDRGELVVAHAGLKEDLHAQDSERAQKFALYGENTGQHDEYGLPIRGDWPSRYQGKPLVVYGHNPVPEVRRVNHTIGLDTGCIFGGKLSALRYPELETVSVVAREVYYQSPRPFPRATDTIETPLSV